jgi:hypothetical protein
MKKVMIIAWLFGIAVLYVALLKPRRIRRSFGTNVLVIVNGSIAKQLDRVICSSPKIRQSWYIYTLWPAWLWLAPKNPAIVLLFANDLPLASIQRLYHKFPTCLVVCNSKDAAINDQIKLTMRVAVDMTTFEYKPAFLYSNGSLNSRVFKTNSGQDQGRQGCSRCAVGPHGPDRICKIPKCD